MRNAFYRFTGVSLLLLLNGCHVESYQVSSSVSVSSTGTVTTTVGVSATIKPNAVMSNVEASDVAALPSTGFVVSASLPSSNFTPDGSNIPTTTITAVTDTGFTSSITVQLQPTNPVIGPINTGDAVYSYAVPSTSALNSWAQEVSQNTASSATITSTGGLPFISAQNPGTYPVTVEVSNTQTSPTTSSTQYTVVPQNNGCGGRPRCYPNP